MAQINPLVSQQIIFIGVVAAVGSLVAGTLFPASSVSSHGMLAGVAFRKQDKDWSQFLGVQQATLARLDGFTKAIVQKQAEKEQRLTFFVPASFQGKTIYDVALKGEEKVIALTFDDGPWPNYTEQILEILKQKNVKATFFWIGQHLKSFPQIGQKVVEEGHAIANHTWNHHYHNVNHATAAREIENTAALIYETTGVKTFIFRPPGGVLTNGLAAYAHSQNYLVAMWSSDAKESFVPSKETLINNVLTSSKSGGIVLLHDGGGNRSTTVQALPKIIEELANRGFKFVTLPELLKMQEQQTQPQVAENLAPTPPKPDPIN